ncbi:MAG: ligase-associated damage response box helicase [Pseudobdellovibrio sp.]|jgi:ATP-dependent Lhr-like helicase|nr:ligase-associated damage response box helicase [Pseudobdellovibrio sp.]
MKNKKVLEPVENFFKKKKWTPFPFQRKAWDAILNGDSGLLFVPTGSGKTYAAAMPVFAKLIEKHQLNPSRRPALKALYLTPLRALARDLERALKEPIEAEGWPIKVEGRTGDTKYSLKRKQLTHPADMLLTTPESLAILISQSDAADYLSSVEIVIVDEWHELLATKRGSLLELSLSYLRFLNPQLQVMALSASIGNIEEAARVLCGPNVEPVLIQAKTEKEIDVQALLPLKIDRFPWAGHLGTALRNQLASELDPEVTTLIFTNTRSQAEIWYRALLELRPDMEDVMAVHHGSLSREERESIEEGVRTGDLKWVVCTSSLDLGVDFQPVERVVQIGSPKMIARMLQRAGRSAHRPGGKSRLLFVPTNSWEILELEALKTALQEQKIESRKPLSKPIDVLLQHMTTLACGPGLNMNELTTSLKETYSFKDVTKDEIKWCLNFLTRGGEVLKGYEQFHKLVYDPEQGRYFIGNSVLAKFHRMSIGTIVSQEQISLNYSNRKRIGTVEESFMSKIRKGDVFQFAGRKLEFIMMRDMKAYVKSSTRPTNVIPSWGGNRFPISETLGHAFRERLGDYHDNLKQKGGFKLLQPFLENQKRISALPASDELLMEVFSTKEGEHLFVYPFEGRVVHEGLAQLWGLRFVERENSTFTFSVNDYGFEIVAPTGYDFQSLFDDDFFAYDNVENELSKSMEMTQMTQRRFREIAQVAGLVTTGYPGAPKTGRQLQVSSSLLFEVFTKHEPNNLLLKQSRNEMLQSSLEAERLRHTLQRLQHSKIVWKKTASPSPLAFPLIIEQFSGGTLSNESLEKKVERIKKIWERKHEHTADA